MHNGIKVVRALKLTQWNFFFFLTDLQLDNVSAELNLWDILLVLAGDWKTVW